MMPPNLFGPGGGWVLPSALGLLAFSVMILLALDDLAASRERLESAEAAELGLLLRPSRAPADRTRPPERTPAGGSRRLGP
jgi:hypothetical protein